MAYDFEFAQTRDLIKQCVTNKDYAKFVPMGKGTDDKALCPFHQDTKPSLVLRGGNYRCYVCNIGGDIIDFYMRLNTCTFPDALAGLCQELNIAPIQNTPRAQSYDGLSCYEGASLMERRKRIQKHSIDAFIELAFRNICFPGGSRVKASFVATHFYKPKEHIEFIKDFYNLSQDANEDILAICLAENLINDDTKTKPFSCITPSQVSA